MKNKFWKSFQNVYICVDANLPKFDDCGAVCEKHSLVLCRHHFQYPVRLFYCNDFRFNGVKDFEVLTAFIDFIRTEIRSRRANPGRSLFFIVTKDADFLQDAEKEWSEEGELELNLEFLADSVKFNNIIIQVVFISENDLEVRDYEKIQPRSKLVSHSETRPKLSMHGKDRERWFRGGFRYAMITKINKISHIIFSNRSRKT